MTTQTIKLNLIPGGVMPVVYASQYDNQVNALIFELYNGATPYTVPSGTAILINGTKPDRTGFSYSAATISGYTAICNVTQQMTAVAGDVLCELRLRAATQIIGSINFILRVERSALNDDSVLSETDIPLIEQAIDIAADLEESLQRAETASAAAVAAGEAATTAAARSEVINTNVENIYDNLTSATAAANAAAQAANAAADDLGNISATATTLPTGSSATASYNANTQVLSFGIPRGATGQSGVYTQISGMFAMSVDADGNLYAHYNDDELTASNFRYDSTTGNLYYVIP